MGKKHFCFLKPPRPGTEPRTLASKAAVLTTTLGPPPQDTTNIPKLPGPPNTEMPKFEITVQGVTKLLNGLNGGKAPGPDELSNLILKNAANEISPFLKIIF